MYIQVYRNALLERLSNARTNTQFPTPNCQSRHKCSYFVSVIKSIVAICISAYVSWNGDQSQKGETKFQEYGKIKHTIYVSDRMCQQLSVWLGLQTETLKRHVAAQQNRLANWQIENAQRWTDAHRMMSEAAVSDER